MQGNGAQRSASGISLIQQQALGFVDSLMAAHAPHRPSAEEALQHPFLDAASMAYAELEMKLLLPDFCQEKDLLPVVARVPPLRAAPMGRSCPSEAGPMGSSWDISALHGSAPMPHAGSTTSGSVLDLAELLMCVGMALLPLLLVSAAVAFYLSSLPVNCHLFK